MLVVFRLFERTPGTFFFFFKYQIFNVLDLAGLGTNGPRNEYGIAKMWFLCDGPHFLSEAYCLLWRGAHWLVTRHDDVGGKGYGIS